MEITSWLRAEMLRSGPGIKAVTKTATEILFGNLSIVWETANPPKLWPTRITVSCWGRASMKSINGLKKSDIDFRLLTCWGSTPEAAKSIAVTLWPDDLIRATSLNQDQAPWQEPWTSTKCLVERSSGDWRMDWFAVKWNKMKRDSKIDIRCTWVFFIFLRRQLQTVGRLTVWLTKYCILM